MIYRFITVDRQVRSDTAAIWTTSCFDDAPRHVNAVVISLADDVDAMWKVRTLTRHAVVIATEGSDLSDLPLDHDPHNIHDVLPLVDVTKNHQARVTAAVEAFAIRPDPKTGKTSGTPRKIMMPRFRESPDPARFTPVENTPQHRALATESYVRDIWEYWIDADEQRRRRTRSLQGTSPWMMPPELSSTSIEYLPEGFWGELRTESGAVDMTRPSRSAESPDEPAALQGS